MILEYTSWHLILFLFEVANFSFWLPNGFSVRPDGYLIQRIFPDPRLRWHIGAGAILLLPLITARLFFDLRLTGEWGVGDGEFDFAMPSASFLGG